jgi:hypothetical protein
MRNAQCTITVLPRLQLKFPALVKTLAGLTVIAVVCKRLLSNKQQEMHHD